MNTQTEPDEDDLRYAREDLGPNASEDEVQVTAERRAAERARENADTQTEPRRPRPKPGTEIRADQLATDNLVGLTIAHPDTDEPFTIAKVDMHGGLVLLWSTDGGQTDIDPDSPVDVVAP